LEDSIESDLLLHVIDAHDPLVEDKIQVVDKILEDIGATQKQIYVFNKIDLISERQRKELAKLYKHHTTLWISAHNGL